jgi:hypothetical protein
MAENIQKEKANMKKPNPDDKLETQLTLKNGKRSRTIIEP